MKRIAMVILPVFLGLVLLVFAQEKTGVFPGADEQTPSRSEYFSWINNTNEGATEAQTLVNLDFFRWLQEEFGMALDIYAFDAGAIDGKRFYGNMDSERFRRQFPRGFDPIYEEANKILVDDAPYVYMYNKKEIRAYAPYVQGFVVRPDQANNFWMVWLSE